MMAVERSADSVLRRYLSHSKSRAVCPEFTRCGAADGGLSALTCLGANPHVETIVRQFNRITRNLSDRCDDSISHGFKQPFSFAA